MLCTSLDGASGPGKKSEGRDMGDGSTVGEKSCQEILAESLLDMAKAVHEHYGMMHPDSGLESWDRLTDDFKYSNIRQVLTIPEKLRAIGCYIDLADGKEQLESFTDDEREILSELEHDIWVEERLSRGWIYGLKLDRKNHISPNIAPWIQLEEKEKEKDFETTDFIIPLLAKFGLGVFRMYKPIEHFRYDRRAGFPLIISVTGHRDLTEDGKRRIREGVDALVKQIEENYPETKIIVMSALAEGADREFANAFLEKKITVAPVFPTDVETYKKTFLGIGHTKESDEEFEKILEDENTLTPCIISHGNVNEVEGFRRLSAFLVGNSHILMAAWDGWTTNYNGGAIGTVKMACGGIGSDLLPFIPPKSPVTEDPRTIAHYLNSGEDVLVYWVKVDRATEQEYGEGAKLCIPEGRDISGGRFLFEIDEFSDKTILEKFNDISVRLKSVLPSASGMRRDAGPDTVEDFSAEVLPGRFWALDSRMPIQHDGAFRKLNQLNKEILGILPEGAHDADFDHDRYLEDGYGLLDSDMAEIREVRQGGCMEDMAGRFWAVSELKTKYERKTNRSNMILSSLSVLYTMFFSMMVLFSTSTMITLAWAFSFIVALAVAFLHSRSDEYRLYMEYRALCEALRVEFYWGIAGVNDCVTANSLGYVKNGMSWMRTAMKGCSSFFVNDYSKCTKMSQEYRLKAAEECWVIQTQKSAAEKAKKQWTDSDRYSLGNNAVSFVITGLAVITGIIVVFFLNEFSVVVFDLSDGINESSITISSFTLLKLLMIFLIAISSVLTILLSRYEVTSRGEAKAASMLFAIAKLKLNTPGKTSSRRIFALKRGIFHDLGLAVLKENDDWVREFSKKDYKRNKLFSAVNRAKNGSQESLESTNNRSGMCAREDGIPHRDGPGRGL